MSWICPSCSLTNVNANETCADSKCREPRTGQDSFDSFDEALSQVWYRQIDRFTNFYLRKKYLGGEQMTPQEELFVSLYNDYKTNPQVLAMTDLELRAHREKLVEIAFKARASASAVDDILKERKPKGPQGFAKSINTDDTTTDAINTIKERQKRLTKNEKIQAGLAKLLGGDEKEAAKLMSAGTILGRIKAKLAGKTQENSSEEPPKPFVNPFEKKEDK